MLPLTNSKDCNSYLRNIWEYDTINYEEYIYAVFLDSKGRRIDYKCIDKGRFSDCDLPPEKVKKLVSKAIKLKAKFIVLAHNHPCGNLEPSPGDITRTKRLITILQELDITLVDHLILTDSDYFSFKDNSLIQGKMTA